MNFNIPAGKNIESLNFANTFYVSGENASHIFDLIRTILSNNNIIYGTEADGIIVFDTQYLLNIDEFLKLSKKYPQNMFFWTWVNDKTLACESIRFTNGKIVKRKTKCR